MTFPESPASDMSTAFSAYKQKAYKKAYKEGRGVDFALVCQGVVKNVHSQVWGGGVLNFEILVSMNFTLPLILKLTVAHFFHR